jgi:aryl carrier-like protein
MDGRIIQGIDPIELIRLVDKRKTVHQRVMLNELEKIIDPNTNTFKRIRKLILDNSNDFSRTIIKEIFGSDFEGEIT